VNSVERLVKKHIYLDRELTTPVVKLCLAYLLRGMDINTWRYRIREVYDDPDLRVEGLRKDLTNRLYILRNLTSFLYSGKPWGVKKRDLGMREYIKGPAFQKVIKAHSIKYGMRSYRPIQTEIDRSSKVIYQRACRYAAHKCYFITKSFSLEKEDIAAELYSCAIRSVWLTYPQLSSPSHVGKLMNTTVHNSGVNLIHAYTTQKKQRIYFDPHAQRFDNRSVSLDALTENGLGAIVKDTSGEVLDLKYSVQQVQDRYRGKKLFCIQMLMGGYNAEFTRWLRAQGVTLLCNDDWYESINPKRLIEALAEYLEVDEDKLWAFVRVLKKHLS